MPTPVRESVKSKLRRYLVAGMKSIQSGRGYTYDVACVKELWTDYENIPEMPFINIFPIGEIYSTSREQGMQFTGGMMEKIVVFSIDFIVKAGDDPILAQEQITNDMESYFGNFYMIPNPDSTPEQNDFACREAIIVSNQSFGLASNPGFVGVTFRIHCYIGQSLQNPGVQI